MPLTSESHVAIAPLTPQTERTSAMPAPSCGVYPGRLIVTSRLNAQHLPSVFRGQLERDGYVRLLAPASFYFHSASSIRSLGSILITITTLIFNHQDAFREPVP
jgi:hypothetical protein